MSAKIETGTVVEVDPVKFQFIQAVVLYLIPPDKIERVNIKQVILKIV